MIVLLAIACSGSDDGKAPPDTEPFDTHDPARTDDTADTGTPTTPPRASCARAADNPLRVLCTANLDNAGPATVVLSAPGAPDRTASSEADATEHELLVWALKPDTTYSWILAGESGAVTTGSLEGPIAGLTVTTTGTAWGFDAVVQSVVCSGSEFAVAIDGDGDLVWFEDIGIPIVAGYDWSDADKSFLAVNGDAFIEVGWDGSHPLTLLRGTDFDGPAHHDTHRWGPYTYLLEAVSVQGSDGVDYVVDAVEVFEGSKPVGFVSLGDLYDPGVIAGEDKDGFWEGYFPGHVDWSHGNAITVEDGELLLSLRWLDSALALDGDPTSPTFGQPRWLAVGSTLSLPNPDYAPLPGPDEGFDGQHHVTRVGDELWMFDNRSAGLVSRALRLTLDDVAGTVAVDAAWDLEQNCPIHGGAYPLEGGGVLATCATRAQVLAYAEGATTPGWTMAATCSAVSQTLKGIPIRF